MYELKAIKGNLDLSKFDLSQLINECNNNAQNINNHNECVKQRFKEMILSYYFELNHLMDALDLDFFHFKGYTISDLKINVYADGINQSLYFGHGRGSIEIKFSTSFENCGRKLSCDFKGKIKILKDWSDIFSCKEYILSSVSQILELGEDVIKLHIINRDITDHTERRLQEAKLRYL